MTGATIDHVALLPAYVAAGTAVLVLLADLLVARRVVTVAVAAAGAVAAAVSAAAVSAGDDRATFCVGTAGCSYEFDGFAGVVGVLFALLTLGVLALSASTLSTPGGAVPVGEYCFLLACSMTGGVVLGAAGDLITLIVALETLTLPLYLLVALRRTVAAAEGAVTFFVVSVVATAVSLLGAALLYAVTGALHLRALGAAFGLDPPADGAVAGPPAGSAALDLPLAHAAVALLVAGLAFKIAAVPFHAWAPVTYDGASLPVAAYLSTASKLGGVVALLYVWRDALPPATTGPVLAAIAVLTMTVGNLVALRQTRMVRLLAWSSVAQAGYVLAPLGVAASVRGRADDALAAAAAATAAYAVFFVVMELGAFAAVIALRHGPGGAGVGSGGAGLARPAGLAGAHSSAPGGAGRTDGGAIADYRGAARARPWTSAALVLALVGLAGLPPGLAGLFAKVTVVRALLGGGAGWLALVVALNAVVGLAYYVRVAAALYAPRLTDPGAAAPQDESPAGLILATVAVATVAAIVIGVAPQLVLDAADLAGR